MSRSTVREVSNEVDVKGFEVQKATARRKERKLATVNDVVCYSDDAVIGKIASLFKCGSDHGRPLKRVMVGKIARPLWLVFLRNFNTLKSKMSFLFRGPDLLLQDAIEASRVIPRVGVQEEDTVGRRRVCRQRGPSRKIGRNLQNVISADAAKEL